MMSDGNINRNLLPYHNFQSGVRAGRASMRTLAYKALTQILMDEGYGVEEIEHLTLSFRKTLEKL